MIEVVLFLENCQEKVITKEANIFDSSYGLIALCQQSSEGRAFGAMDYAKLTTVFCRKSSFL